MFWLMALILFHAAEPAVNKRKCKVAHHSSLLWNSAFHYFLENFTSWQVNNPNPNRLRNFIKLLLWKVDTKLTSKWVQSPTVQCKSPSLRKSKTLWRGWRVAEKTVASAALPCAVLFGAFQVTRPPLLHPSYGDWLSWPPSPAPSTPGLPVLCPPLTITLVSHRQGRSENRLRQSTQARAGLPRVFGEGVRGGPPFSISLSLPKWVKRRRVVSSVTLPHRDL